MYTTLSARGPPEIHKRLRENGMIIVSRACSDIFAHFGR